VRFQECALLKEEGSKLTVWAVWYHFVLKLINFFYSSLQTSVRKQYSDPLLFFQTVGAIDWEHFIIDGRHYLAVANYYDDSPNRYTYLVDSFVFEFQEDIRQFVKLQNLPTHG